MNTSVLEDSHWIMTSIQPLFQDHLGSCCLLITDADVTDVTIRSTRKPCSFFFLLHGGKEMEEVPCSTDSFIVLFTVSTKSSLAWA